MNDAPKAVVVLSGGMDSTTLLYKVIADGYAPAVVSFNYGQRHKKELNYARTITRRLGLQHKVVDLRSINPLLQGSALTTKNVAVPEGHYAEESMKATVVPNRNMIMLSLATGYAVSIGANNVFFGAHAGDHAIYPDCRKEFVKKLSDVTRIANYTPVEVHAPFLKMDKGDIVELGIKLGVPFSNTWTCYVGKAKPCKKCGACVERMEAMAKAGYVDRQYA